MRLLLALPILFAAAAAAGQSAAFSEHSLRADGVERSYLLRAPAAAAQADGRPLIIMLHGHGGNARDLVGEGKTRTAPYREWVPIADRANLLLVAPEGLRGSDGKQGWNDCRRDATTNPAGDDVAFLLALVDAVDRETRVDRRRVFVVGTSNGGHMALRMAIERPDRIAGAAVVVAAMPARSECTAPAQAVPVLFMNGTDDPLLPFNGGEMAGGKGRGAVLSTPASAEIWRGLAGIAGTPERARIGAVERLAYAQAGTPKVALYRVEGGGHTEPSKTEFYARFYKRIVGPQNTDIEMAEEVWQFFAAQRP